MKPKKNNKDKEPHFLEYEFILMEKRKNKAIAIYERIKDEIDPRIGFIQAISLIDFGIDITQISAKDHGAQSKSK